ncbi:MAG: sigma-70 family RNA polymerase sigma factor [Deltaproteobacteria bacterium]|nr:sigma-70 family RNA polymerase sigma factor [Deltaproteobacteria bacterium]
MPSGLSAIPTNGSQPGKHLLFFQFLIKGRLRGFSISLRKSIAQRFEGFCLYVSVFATLVVFCSTAFGKTLSCGSRIASHSRGLRTDLAVYFSRGEPLLDDEVLEELAITIRGQQQALAALLGNGTVNPNKIARIVASFENAHRAGKVDLAQIAVNLTRLKSPRNDDLDQKTVVSFLSEYQAAREAERFDLARVMQLVSDIEYTRNRIVSSNIRLVKSIAEKRIRAFPALRLELDDLIEEGNLGLINAAETFDPARGVRFSSWAGTCIENAINKAIWNKTGTVYLPPAWIQLRLAYDQKASDLSKNGVFAQSDDVWDALGILPEQRLDSEKKIAAASLFRKKSALETKTDGQKQGLVSTYPDPRQELPTSSVDTNDLLTALMGGLTAEEQTVVIQHDGLGRSFREIGLQIGRSKSRAQQIWGEAKEKLMRRARVFRDEES